MYRFVKHALYRVSINKKTRKELFKKKKKKGIVKTRKGMLLGSSCEVLFQKFKRY